MEKTARWAGRAFLPILAGYLVCFSQAQSQQERSLRPGASGGTGPEVESALRSASMAFGQLRDLRADHHHVSHTEGPDVGAKSRRQAEAIARRQKEEAETMEPVDSRSKGQVRPAAKAVRGRPEEVRLGTRTDSGNGECCSKPGQGDRAWRDLSNQAPRGAPGGRRRVGEVHVGRYDCRNFAFLPRGDASSQAFGTCVGSRGWQSAGDGRCPEFRGVLYSGFRSATSARSLHDQPGSWDWCSVPRYSWPSRGSGPDSGETQSAPAQFLLATDYTLAKHTSSRQNTATSGPCRSCSKGCGRDWYGLSRFAEQFIRSVAPCMAGMDERACGRNRHYREPRCSRRGSGRSRPWYHRRRHGRARSWRSFSGIWQPRVTLHVKGISTVSISLRRICLAGRCHCGRWRPLRLKRSWAKTLRGAEVDTVFRPLHDGAVSAQRSVCISFRAVCSPPLFPSIWPGITLEGSGASNTCIGDAGAWALTFLFGLLGTVLSLCSWVFCTRGIGQVFASGGLFCGLLLAFFLLSAFGCSRALKNRFGSSGAVACYLHFHMRFELSQLWLYGCFSILHVVSAWPHGIWLQAQGLLESEALFRPCFWMFFGPACLIWQMGRFSHLCGLCLQGVASVGPCYGLVVMHTEERGCIRLLLQPLSQTVGPMTALAALYVSLTFALRCLVSIGVHPPMDSSTPVFCLIGCEPGAPEALLIGKFLCSHTSM